MVQSFCSFSIWRGSGRLADTQTCLVCVRAGIDMPGICIFVVLVTFIRLPASPRARAGVAANAQAQAPKTARMLVLFTGVPLDDACKKIFGSRIAWNLTNRGRRPDPDGSFRRLGLLPALPGGMAGMPFPYRSPRQEGSTDAVRRQRRLSRHEILCIVTRCDAP